MAFSIKNDEAHQLARQLVALTGESLTSAVTESLRQRLEREHRRSGSSSRRERLDQLADQIRALPVLDDRSAEQVAQHVMGWNDIGVPT